MPFDEFVMLDARMAPVQPHVMLAARSRRVHADQATEDRASVAVIVENPVPLLPRDRAFLNDRFVFRSER